MEKWNDIRIDGLVRLEIAGDFLFLAFIGEDGADEADKAVGGNTSVQLELRWIKFNPVCRIW